MNRISRGLLLLGVASSMALAQAAGCTRPRRGERPAPLMPPSARLRSPTAAEPLSPVDQPGAIQDDTRGGAVVPVPREGDSNRQAVEGVSETVEENVTPPGVVPQEAMQPAAPAPATAPALAPAPDNGGPLARQGVTTGQFLTIGGVVAVVNHRPIYANEVIELVEPVLAARAKELNEQQFRAVADKEIKQQIFALRNLELEYAAAERNLDERDKELADLLTQQWRARQITEAGGSIELARRNAPEIARRNRLNPNASFEELVQEMYRVFMSRVYYEKKIMPRIQVSAAEMRDYYLRHRDQLFADPGSAQFRVIRIDVQKAGGREEAQRRITSLRNRIVKAGEPFEAIARTVNDNPLLLKTGGLVTVDRGAFAERAVEDAVWATPQGQVTDVIDAGDAFYIAQVLEKRPGRVQPFEDEAVQARIMEDLRARDFRAMRQKVQQELEQNAVIRSDPTMMNTALEMAMQSYPKWAGE